MLTKRTNILFDEQLFNHLVVLAQKNKTSIGELVRKAVIKVYITQKNQEKMRAYEEILKLKKDFGPITTKEIKELINYGRKY